MLIKATKLETDLAMTSRLDWVLLAMLAVSLLSNIALGVTAMRLASRGNAATAPQPEALAVGTRLPALEGRDPAGQRQRLEFSHDGKPTLLYVYTPSCTWCARNLGNAKALFAATNATYRNVALSLADTPGNDTVEFQSLATLLSSPTRSVIDAYHLGPTPMTVVISPDGRVTEAWTGVVSRQVVEIQRAVP